MGSSLADLISLSVFTFGALAFSVPAVYYWREWAARKAKPSAFAALSVACALAFLSGLIFQGTIEFGGNAALSTVLALVRTVTMAALPALLLHVAAGLESRRWRWLLSAFYLGATLTVIGLWFGIWPEEWDASSSFLLAACVAGLVVLLTRKPADDRDRAHRRWTTGLFVALGACAVATLSGYGSTIGAAPDYLLLVWFCVSLYYLERLVFFDVLVKRGAFLAVGIAAIVTCTAAAGAPWTYAAGLLLCWLLAPAMRAGVERAIDRYWLRRECTSEEAERRFVEEAQTASSEEELRTLASASLRRIFLADAEVRFDAGELIRLAPRANGLPFLSGDRKLLRSIEQSLRILLENVRYREEQRRLQELTQRAELKALRAQIDPHFLFNTLSAIAGLLHYQPDLAEETVERLAQVFRYTLRQSQSEWASLADEVEFASAYLRIAQARLGDRLQLWFEVDEVLGQAQIPAMSIQPLVENAIQHGVAAVDGCGEVALLVARVSGRIRIEVRDTGRGFPAGFSLEQDGEGHGLRNVAERLRGYYGAAAQLFWEHTEAGTRVAMELPEAADSGAAGMVRDARAHSR